MQPEKNKPTESIDWIITIFMDKLVSGKFIGKEISEVTIEFKKIINKVINDPRQPYLFIAINKFLHKILNDERIAKESKALAVVLLNFFYVEITGFCQPAFDQLEINNAFLPIFVAIVLNCYDYISFYDLFESKRTELNNQFGNINYGEFLIPIVQIIDEKIWPALGEHVKTVDNIQAMSRLILREVANIEPQYYRGFLEAINKLKNLKIDLMVRDSQRYDGTFLHILLSKSIPKEDLFSLFVWLASNNLQTLMTARDGHGRTPLILSVLVSEDKYSMVKNLLLLGSDINLADTDGNTTLHHAILLGLKEVVELLLAKGANLTIENVEGITPLLLLQQLLNSSLSTNLDRVRQILGSVSLYQKHTDANSVIAKSLFGWPELSQVFSTLNHSVEAVTVIPPPSTTCQQKATNFPVNREQVGFMVKSMQAIFDQSREQKAMQEKLINSYAEKMLGKNLPTSEGNNFPIKRL